MRKVRLTLAALVVIAACAQEGILPQKPAPQDKAINCRTCDGTWDTELTQNNTFDFSMPSHPAVSV